MALKFLSKGKDKKLWLERILPSVVAISMLKSVVTLQNYVIFVEMMKYRLRWDRKIVGYAEQTPQGILFKGKEWLWFLRGKPRYNQIDECIGCKDKLNRDIYESDIVLYSINDKLNSQKGVILWETQSEQFVLYNVENNEVMPLFVNEVFLFENDKVEIVSHLFNQPDLEKKISFKRK